MDYKGFIRVKKSDLVKAAEPKPVESKPVEVKKVDSSKIKIGPRPEKQKEKVDTPVSSQTVSQTVSQNVEPMPMKYTKKVKIEPKKIEPIQKEVVEFPKKVEVSQPIPKETVRFAQPIVEAPVSKPEIQQPIVQIPQIEKINVASQPIPVQQPVPVQQTNGPPVRKYLMTNNTYSNPYRKRISTRHQ